MGLFDRFKKVTTVDTATAAYTGDGAYGSWRLSLEDYEQIMGLSPADMWRTQPYLRTVVTFLARNIAQLGVHTFQRIADDDRERVRDGGVASAFAQPNVTTTSFELIYGLVADLALYDKAYWLLSSDPSQRLTRLPVGWVTERGGNYAGPAEYDVKVNDKGESARIPAAEILAFHGWHPGSLSAGSSPVHALREILAEQVQAAKYRETVWRRGGKVGAVLSRPASAPQWSEAARKQFKADYDAQFSGDGPRVGGTAMLEDGMTLNRVDFSAHDMQFIEGSRLALNTVASVYHVNPTMIGLLDNANYSNVREFRRMLYGDTLGPILAQIEDRLNTFLVPRFDSRPSIYVEFNLEEKLQGSFEEQTTALQASVGRPWMTSNEARALRNMPAIEGGDELVTPLNVIVGGQASPVDTAPPAQAAAFEPASKSQQLGNVFELKAKRTQKQTDEVAAVLARFFGHQGKAVLSAIGAGEDWWDAKRWDRELTDDLHAVAMTVTTLVGTGAAKALGYDGEYDVEQTANFLREASARYASTINETTKRKLDRRIANDDDPADVFADDAKTNRASGVATGVTTFLAGFAVHEAGEQIAYRHEGVSPTKTWLTGGNPRSTHAAMSGETVALDDVFSNGLRFPGAGGGEAAEAANCNCDLQINVDGS